MNNDPKLLVVDDQETICQACRRILSPEGFQVETSSDALRGLKLAVEEDYSAILLDIKMPQMDGVKFLQQLRSTKPDVPVIIITAYPSIPNAASVMRLGAVDYVTKPFTPGQITEAVLKLLRPRGSEGEAESGSALPSMQPHVPTDEEFLYWDQSWCQPMEGGAVRVGTVLKRLQGGAVEAVWPPRVKWFVHQGLPLAGVTIAGGLHLTVPSPVSGVVIASNDLLFDQPSVLWDDPCGQGWIACIQPTRLDEETRNCTYRRLLLANTDKTSARHQSAQLTSLGCQVRIAELPGEVGPALQEDPDCNVLVIDAASLGRRGPELAGEINAAASSTRTIVIGSPGTEWESAYRGQGIFYYAVEPFADNEIADIIDVAFRPPHQPLQQAVHRKGPQAFMNRICITDPHGERVGLLAESGLLRRDEGLGRQVIRKLADRRCPAEISQGGAHTIPSAVRQAESTCDRLVILLARGIGRLPGSLVRDEFVPIAAEKVKKVTVLTVEPVSSGGDPLKFEARMTAALAEHIAREMAAC